MTSTQAQLWVGRASRAVAFYVEAFGAAVLHRVGEEDEIVAQLAIATRRSGWLWRGRAWGGSARRRAAMKRAGFCSWWMIPTPF